MRALTRQRYSAEGGWRSCGEEAGDEEKKKTTRLTRRQDRHNEHDDGGEHEKTRMKRGTKGGHRNILTKPRRRK